MKGISLTNAIMKRVADMGADLCGVADLTSSTEYIRSEYGEYCARFPRAVSIAILFPREIVQQQLDGPTRSYEYFYHAINRRLDAAGLAVSSVIQNAGYRACPVPSSDYREKQRAERLQYRVVREDRETLPDITTELYGMFSHRLAAHLAGLGWIGKNCSIINPEVGPRLRLTTVLTEAPLEPGKPLAGRCGSCSRCRDACPAGALKGSAFRIGQPIEDRIDRECCKAQLDRIKAAFGQGTCALCLAVCPWGSKPEKNA